MTQTAQRNEPALGFLTVSEDADQGWFGGYLVVNVTGRPLEFHCTAPVKPKRAQEILFGPTLKPFVFGEQIGPTLVQKSVIVPLLVCTDVAPMLTVRDQIAPPVVLIGDDAQASNPAGRFKLGGEWAVVSAGRPEDREAAERIWRSVEGAFELLEPFERIRCAIAEARRVAA